MLGCSQNKGPAQDGNGVRFMLYGKGLHLWQALNLSPSPFNWFPIGFTPSSPSLKPSLRKLSQRFPKPWPSYVEWCLKWRTNCDNKIVNLHLWQKLFVNILLTKVECKTMSNNKSQMRQSFTWPHVTYNVTTMIMWMYVGQQNTRVICKVSQRGMKPWVEIVGLVLLWKFFFLKRSLARFILEPIFESWADILGRSLPMSPKLKKKDLK